MPDVYNAIKEIETTEISKLQQIVNGYKALKDLHTELHCKSANKEKLKPYADKLQKLLVVYEKIFVIVGDDAEKYVHEEIGVSFTKSDDEMVLAKKLLQFVANDAFFALREKLIIATAEYNELNQLLMNEKLATYLDKPKAIQNIPTSLINCTQLAVQFSLLVQALEKEISQKEISQKKTSDLITVIAPLLTFAKTVADYANEKTRDTENKNSEIVLVDALTPTDSEKSIAHIIANPKVKSALEDNKHLFEDQIKTLRKTLTTTQQEALDSLILQWPKKLKNQTEIDHLKQTSSQNAEALISAKNLRSVGQAIDLIFLQNFPNKQPEITALLDKYTKNQDKLDEITSEMEKLERDPVFKAKRQCQESKTIFLSLLPKIFPAEQAPKPDRVKHKSAYEPKPYASAGKRSKSFIGKAKEAINKFRSSSDSKPEEEILFTRIDSPETPRSGSNVSMTDSTSTEQLDSSSDSPPSSSHNQVIAQLGSSSETLPSPKPLPLSSNSVKGYSGLYRRYTATGTNISPDPQPSSSTTNLKDAEQVITDSGSLEQRKNTLNLSHLSPRK